MHFLLLEALSKDELRRLLSYLEAHDRTVYLMALLQFWHAGRNSEIIHLTRDNFDGDHIKFRRLKGSEPCDQALVSHPDPLLDEREKVFAFLSKLGGKQRLFGMSRFTYLRRLKRAALAVGIRPSKSRTTVLKHSICTYMYENAPANAVQRRAGHKNGANTLRYGKVSESQVDSLVLESVGLA